MDSLTALDRRRRTLRIVLFSIILGTLPLYLLGFLLWVSAPQRPQQRTATATLDQIVVTTAAFASNTPLFLTQTAVLLPTPTNFLPVQPTYVFPTLTIPPVIFPPVSTLAPTLTSPPTWTPITPSWTPITPTLTNTPLPIPTNTPSPTIFILPTDTPSPTLTETPTMTPTETPTETVIPMSP